MSKKEGLEWCVENLPKWSAHNLVGTNFMQAGLVPYENPFHLKGRGFVITEKDWLEAKEDKDMQKETASIPEGATHISDKGFYYQLLDGAWFHYSVLEVWEPSLTDGRWQSENLTELPVVPTEKWQPEIGEKCKYLTKGIDDVEGGVCEVIAISNGRVWLTRHDSVDIILNLEDAGFRPLKTQEEVEREELIDIIDSCNMSSGVLADIIISAGFKK